MAFKKKYMRGAIVTHVKWAWLSMYVRAHSPEMMKMKMVLSSCPLERPELSPSVSG
ncbi:hypothetical protein PISMIDRAFT_686441 [Pisolithus microcarpus 441]|uniref:Uncharacterized protein n=1 Tax=Pisolithus microcarpus 441 TaxID=765257 RepID=A0A0C9YR07_9AGAM|nr:hypothetical protein PISMIDRAFT_686441 [Pisolithus microcarpus 441]